MDTPNDPFAFLKAAWPGFAAYPLSASGLPQSSLPTTDPEEIERRIADLKTVEQWLSLNLNILKTTIQGLEIQKGTLAAVQAWQTSMADLGSQAAPKAQAVQGQNDAPTQDNQSAASLDPQQWWWSSMQDQFNQLVQAAGAMQTATATTPHPQGKAPRAKKSSEKEGKGATASRQPGRSKKATPKAP